jgi:hypothetical protein
MLMVTFMTEKDQAAAGTGHFDFGIEARAIGAYRLAVYKYGGLFLPFEGLQNLTGMPNDMVSMLIERPGISPGNPGSGCRPPRESMQEMKKNVAFCLVSLLGNDRPPQTGGGRNVPGCQACHGSLDQMQRRKKTPRRHDVGPSWKMPCSWKSLMIFLRNAAKNEPNKCVRK